MSYHVYILYSQSIDQYYVGHTENVANRIFRHTNSESKSTKKANDWEIKYIEEFALRSQAVLRELKIKKAKKY